MTELRRATLRLKRRAQRAVAAGRNNADLVKEFKEASKRIKRDIERME